MGGGGKGGGGEAKRARKDEEERQAKIRAGTTRVNEIFDAQFNDDFFNGRQASYAAYANPQLDQQHQDAGKQLSFSLARSGLLDSSVRGEKSSELQKLYDLNKQKVADDALSFGTQIRNSVEDARGNLITTLNATGDAEGAASSAIARSQALSQAPAFSPLTDLFGNFTQGLGTQAALEKSAAYGGGPAPRYSTGLFAPKVSSVQTRK